MRPFYISVIFIIISSAFSEMTQSEIENCYDNSFAYETAQNYDRAIESLGPVYKNYPTGYTVNYRLGWLYYLKGNYANATGNLKTALTVYPYSVEVMNTMNMINVAKMDWEQVEVRSLKVFQIDYYNYYANYYYCLALMKQKKYSDAAKAADKMLIIFPTDVTFLTLLAESTYLDGDTENGLKIFESVITLHKDNETARYYLGR